MRRSRFTSTALSSAFSGARSRVRSLSLAGLAAGALASGCAADTDERPATFEVVVTQILRPSCATATCHNAATRTENYDFSTLDSAREAMDYDLVPVGGTDEPDKTRLVHALTDSGEERMPVDSPLPDADIQLIREWIVDGAVR